jgi:competence protein ComEC
VAIISSGYGNRFGHPHPAVLNRLQHAGIRYFDTADSGALIFEFRRGEPVAVRRYRDQQRRFWM